MRTGLSPQNDHIMNKPNLKLSAISNDIWAVRSARRPADCVPLKESEDEVCFATDYSPKPVRVHEHRWRCRGLAQCDRRQQLLQSKRNLRRLPIWQQRALRTADRTAVYCALTQRTAVKAYQNIVTEAGRCIASARLFTFAPNTWTTGARGSFLRPMTLQ